jgi:hypothetical protein
VTITTNAGNDDRLSPQERRVAAQHDLDHSLDQVREEKGRAAAARRTRQKWRALPMESQQATSVMVDGELRTFSEGIALEFEFEEPEYDDSVRNIFRHTVGPWKETAWWPVKAPGARAGLRPPLGPKAWEAILDQGLYCMKCGWRHDEPWPEECTHCFLTATRRTRWLEHLESVGHLWQTQGPNREQRRAQQRGVKRSKGGVILPGMALAPGS